ncbi:MAG: hypothetical protein QOJ64_2815 [Acidobacteriota bacterium]|jgi:hypothetical protein|nr:hypothetical protein [Acidobacteriota bacterium]
MPSAWETIRNESRRSPRYQIRLSASVFIFEGIDEGHSPAVLAYTRDLSRDGLCLIMPDGALGSSDLEREARPLRITLGLPNEGSVDLVGRLVYRLPYKGSITGSEWVVGVKLEESEGLKMYHELVESLFNIR